MTKFFEEFTLKSKGEFPMLKLSSATYYKDKRELVVRFIISAFEVRDFDEESKKKVQGIVEENVLGCQSERAVYPHIRRQQRRQEQDS